MTLHRLVPALIAAAFAAPALADGSSQAQRLHETLAARAPLAVSGDGAWRLHVDTHDVLHRVALADPTHETTLQLPPGVQVIAASGDGVRVALSTRLQCVGLVDFGTRPGEAARLTWRPWVMNGSAPLGPDVGGWTAQMPVACGEAGLAAPVAISSDGRLVATADGVVDGATNRVVASLPRGAATVLRTQFVDHDARLLVVAAQPGQPFGSLDLSVWDLASKALVNHVEVPGLPLAAAAALHVEVSAQTGAVFFADERRRDGARAAAPQGTTPSPLPLDLSQAWPGACGAATRVRAPLGDDVGASFAVDPYGRWMAWARPLDAAHDAAELATGARTALVVQDMATGRRIERVGSRFALDGLVATPDGATLLALAVQPIEPETGDRIAGWPAAADAEQVVEIRLPDAALAVPRDAARAWATGFCREPGETPAARAPAGVERALKAAWSRDMGPPAAPTGNDPCAAMASSPDLFRAPDGALWLDLGAQVLKLDPATGTTSTGLPTPRAKGVCSVVTPNGNGFVNASGDTLTWRPLAAATEPGKRRVIDRRAGWRIAQMGQSGELVRVVWSQPSADLLVVFYDANGKRVREIPTTVARLEAARDSGVDPDQPPTPPCRDVRGAPLSIGYDWRAGPFGSQRGATCGPLPGEARLIWWSGASIAPRADRSAPMLRAQPAIDGAIAVAADDTQLHVVNLALQREIAQIPLADGFDGRTWVLASRKLVLLESTGADGHRWLRAYALP